MRRWWWRAEAAGSKLPESPRLAVGRPGFCPSWPLTQIPMWPGVSQKRTPVSSSMKWRHWILSVSVSFCWVTNHPQSWWCSLCLTVLCDSDLGQTQPSGFSSGLPGLTRKAVTGGQSGQLGLPPCGLPTSSRLAQAVFHGSWAGCPKTRVGATKLFKAWPRKSCNVTL